MLATACWGSLVVTVKIASRGLDTWAVTTIELLVAVVVLAGVLGARRVAPVRPQWGLLLAGALEPALAYVLINAGLARTSGTHGAIIIGLQSLMVVAAAALLHRQVPSARVALGLALALAGVLAVTITTTDERSSLVGDLLVLLGVACAAGYVVTAHRLAARFDGLDLTFYQFAAGSLVFLPFAAVALWSSGGGGVAEATSGELAAAVAAGVIGSALAFTLYNRALREISAAFAGISLTLIPVFGVTFSLVFLGESLSAQILGGGVLVVAGVALSQRSEAL